MGASTFKRTHIVLGKDGAGQDFKAFGDTPGAYIRWNHAINKLQFIGGADMDFGSFGIPLTIDQDNNYTLGIFGEVSVANSEGTNVERGIWSRVKVSKAQTGAFSIFGGQLQFRWAEGCGTLGSGVENAQYGGAWLYLEQDTAGQALADFAHVSGAVIQVETYKNLTIPTDAHLSGLQIESRLGSVVPAGALENVSGKIAGLFITKSPAASGVTAQNWPYGIFIENCDVGIHLESTQKIQFKDDGIYIHSPADGKIKISADGDGTDDITLDGAVTITGYVNQTITGSATGDIGFHSRINQAEAFSGAIAGFFGQAYLSTPSGTIGNAFGGCFEVKFETGFAAAGELVVGLYAGAFGDVAGAVPNTCLMVEAIPGTLADFSNMPLMVLMSSGDGTQPNIAIEFGHEPAGKSVTSGTSGKMYYRDTLQIKVNTDARYIPLSTEEGTFTTAYPISTTSTIKGRIAELGAAVIGNDFQVTVTAPNNALGMAGYFQTTVKGAIAGHIYGIGSWINFDSTPTCSSTIIAAQDNGIYGTATLTNTRVIFGMRMEAVITASPAILCPFSINVGTGGITALFAVDALAAISWIDGVHTSPVSGSLPILCSLDGAVVKYIRTYDTPA